MRKIEQSIISFLKNQQCDCLTSKRLVQRDGIGASTITKMNVTVRLEDLIARKIRLLKSYILAIFMAMKNLLFKIWSK